MKAKYILCGLMALLMLAILTVIAVKHTKWLHERAIRMDVVKHFPFSRENALMEWKEKIFKGKVIYKVSAKDHENFVLATSKGTASALFYKIKLDIDKRPIISWKWNVKSFPAKDGHENLRNAKEDDFAARVYVIFPAFFFTGSRAIEYIWAEKVEEGTIAPSPYSKNLQLFVVESGANQDDEWVYEERDVYKDYQEAFGEKPRYDIGAVAFMTDADSTETFAEALYDEIKMGYKEEGGDDEKHISH